MFPGRVILASRSPRRAQLLAQAGFRWAKVDPPFADPPQPPGQVPDPAALARDLAFRKAESVLRSDRFAWESGDVLLAADTIVLAPPPASCLLGQPENQAEAGRMLALLLGKTHQVVTGVAIGRIDPRRRGDPSQLQTFADVAQVTLGGASLAWQRRYLQAGHWRGKAGGYNLAELLDLETKVAGDPTTVVGLPMRWLRAWLRRQAS